MRLFHFVIFLLTKSMFESVYSMSVPTSLLVFPLRRLVPLITCLTCGRLRTCLTHHSTIHEAESVLDTLGQQLLHSHLKLLLRHKLRMAAPLSASQTPGSAS